MKHVGCIKHLETDHSRKKKSQRHKCVSTACEWNVNVCNGELKYSTFVLIRDFLYHGQTKTEVQGEEAKKKKNKNKKREGKDV